MPPVMPPTSALAQPPALLHGVLHPLLHATSSLPRMGLPPLAQGPVPTLPHAGMPPVRLPQPPALLHNVLHLSMQRQPAAQQALSLQRAKLLPTTALLLPMTTVLHAAPLHPTLHTGS